MLTDVVLSLDLEGLSLFKFTDFSAKYCSRALRIRKLFDLSSMSQYWFSCFIRDSGRLMEMVAADICWFYCWLLDLLDVNSFVGS